MSIYNYIYIYTQIYTHYYGIICAMRMTLDYTFS